MEPRDLDYFAVVAKFGNVRRAAESLSLSQPALSKALRRLELSIGAKLVKRVPKGIELTTVGNAMLTHVERLRLAREDAMRQAADLSHGRAGHLRIGVGFSMAQTLLPVACSTLTREAPAVTLKIAVSPNDVLVPALRNGDLDLIVSGIPAIPLEGLAHEYIHDDEFVAYASVKHNLARRKKLTLRDLADEKWVASTNNVLSWQRLKHAFERIHLPPPRIAIDTSSTRIKFPVVATSNLLGYTAQRVVVEASQHFSIVELRVPELSWRRQVGISYRRDAYLSPTARRFIDLLKQVATGLNYR